MDFAYLVLTFLQRHPRKLLVLLGGRAVDYGVFFFFLNHRWTTAESLTESQYRMVLLWGKQKHIRLDEISSSQK